MNRPATGIAGLCLLLVLAATGAADDAGSPRTISVTGEAQVRIAPDEVILTLGIETVDEDLGTAKKQNDGLARQILAIGESHGIAPHHVQTSHLSIEPRYENHHRQTTFLGYFVRKTVVFTLRDVSRFEELLSAALEAGANYVHGIQFRTTELLKHRNKARAIAIRAAREKAVALAGELGQKVGEPRSIQEQHAGWWSPYNRWWGGGGYGMGSQRVVQGGGGGQIEGDGSIALGQIEVNARVSVTFELR